MHTKTTHIHSPGGLEPITAGKHLLFRPLCTLSLCQLRLSLAKGEKDWEGKRNELRQSNGRISGPQQSCTLRRLLGFRNVPPSFFFYPDSEKTRHNILLNRKNIMAYTWTLRRPILETTKPSAVQSIYLTFLWFLFSSVTSHPAIQSSSRFLIICLDRFPTKLWIFTAPSVFLLITPNTAQVFPRLKQLYFWLITGQKQDFNAILRLLLKESKRF